MTNGPEFKILETGTGEDAWMQGWEPLPRWTLPLVVVRRWDSSQVLG